MGRFVNSNGEYHIENTLNMISEFIRIHYNMEPEFIGGFNGIDYTCSYDLTIDGYTLFHLVVPYKKNYVSYEEFMSNLKVHGISDFIKNLSMFNYSKMSNESVAKILVCKLVSLNNYFHIADNGSLVISYSDFLIFLKNYLSLYSYNVSLDFDTIKHETDLKFTGGSQVNVVTDLKSVLSINGEVVLSRCHNYSHESSNTKGIDTSYMIPDNISISEIKEILIKLSEKYPELSSVLRNMNNMSFSGSSLH